MSDASPLSTKLTGRSQAVEERYVTTSHYSDASSPATKWNTLQALHQQCQAKMPSVCGFYIRRVEGTVIPISAHPPSRPIFACLTWPSPPSHPINPLPPTLINPPNPHQSPHPTPLNPAVPSEILAQTVNVDAVRLIMYHQPYFAFCQCPIYNNILETSNSFFAVQTLNSVCLSVSAYK